MQETEETDLVVQEAHLILKQISDDFNSPSMHETAAQFKVLMKSFTSKRMVKVTDIIYKQACHKPHKVHSLAEICNLLKNITYTKVVGEVKTVTTFKAILITIVLRDIKERVTYKDHLGNLVQNYKGTEERKQKWLKSQHEQLQKYLTKTAGGSTKFINKLFLLNIFTCDTMLKIFEMLKTIPENESAEYLNILLMNCGGKIKREFEKTELMPNGVENYFQEMLTFIQQNSQDLVNEDIGMKNTSKP